MFHINMPHTRITNEYKITKKKEIIIPSRLYGLDFLWIWNCTLRWYGNLFFKSTLLNRHLSPPFVKCPSQNHSHVFIIAQVPLEMQHHGNRHTCLIIGKVSCLKPNTGFKFTVSSSLLSGFPCGSSGLSCGKCTKTPVLVYWGLRNKTPATERLKQQKLTVSEFQSLETQNQGARRWAALEVCAGGLCSGPLPWACRWLSPCVFSHCLPCMCVCLCLSFPFNKDICHIGLSPPLWPHFNLITS